MFYVDVTPNPQNLFMSPRHVNPMPNQLHHGMSKSISWTGNLNGHLPIQHQPSKAAIGGGNGSSFSATTSPINQPSIRPLLKSSNSDYSIVSLTRKPNGDSLIDLGQDLIRPDLITKVSVLEAFDPLLIDHEDEEFAMREALEEDFPDTETIYSDSSFHEHYDPFDYMPRSIRVAPDTDENVYSTIPEPIYSTPNKRPHNKGLYLGTKAEPDQETLEQRKKLKAEYENWSISNNSSANIGNLLTLNWSKRFDSNLLMSFSNSSK